MDEAQHQLDFRCTLSRQQMPEFDPIFIGGAGRSGTTLVVDMVGLHPRISPIYETDFVSRINKMLFRQDVPAEQAAGFIFNGMDTWSKSLPQRPHNKRDHERYHHGPHYLLFDREFAMARTNELIARVRNGEKLEGMRAFMSDLFAEHCRLDKKPMWANKNPDYVEYLPELHNLFPTMRFLHCVRDGRDVACSVVTRPWGPTDFASAATWWKQKVEPALQFANQHPGRCLIVRYEDLVQKPLEELTRITEWLGEPADLQAILASYGVGEVRLDESRLGQWSKSFSDKDKEEFRRQAGDLLQQFGYAE